MKGFDFSACSPTLSSAELQKLAESDDLNQLIAAIEPISLKVKQLHNFYGGVSQYSLIVENIGVMLQRLTSLIASAPRLSNEEWASLMKENALAPAKKSELAVKPKAEEKHAVFWKMVQIAAVCLGLLADILALTQAFSADETASALASLEEAQREENRLKEEELQLKEEELRLKEEELALFRSLISSIDCALNLAQEGLDGLQDISEDL